MSNPRTSGGVLGPKRLVSPQAPGTAKSVRDARKSMREINKTLQRIIDGIEDATPEALLFAVEPVLKESDRLVPKDTETLRESQYAETFSTGATRLGIEVGYGRFDAPAGKSGKPPSQYAAIVHERPDLKHDSPTQFKYLQIPFQQALGQFDKRVRDFLGGMIP